MLIKKQTHKNTPVRSLITSAITLVLACAALKVSYAQEVEFTPYISASESYTDNVNGSENNRDSDFYTTLAAGFKSSVEGNHVSFDADYDFMYDHYQQTDNASGVRHNLLADGTAELVDKWLIFDAKVAVSQEDLTNFGGTTAGDRNGLSDQTVVINYEFGPSLVHRLGGFGDVRLDYRYSAVDFRDADVGSTGNQPASSDTHSIETALDSGDDFRILTWGLFASYADITQDAQTAGGTDRESSQANADAEINYHFDNRFYGIGRIGYDDVDDDNINNSKNGAYYFAGAGITGGNRLAAEITYGKRYDEGLLDANISYRPTERTFFGFTHHTSVQTQQQQIANQNIRDINGNLVNPNALNSTFVDETVKSTSSEFNFTHTRARTGYGVRVGLEERDFFSDNTEDQSLYITADVTHLLQRDLEAGIDVSYSDTLETRNANTDQSVSRIGGFLSYNATETLFTSVSYDYFDRQDDTGGDIYENLIRINLIKEF